MDVEPCELASQLQKDFVATDTIKASNLELCEKIGQGKLSIV